MSAPAPRPRCRARRARPVWSEHYPIALAAGRGAGRFPHGYPQHRDHRPCRPRQDHPGRCDAAPIGRVPRQSAGGRAGARFERARTRARHHDPGEMHLGRVARRAHQHRRHPGPCRFRRRGRAHPQHGRRRPGIGRRRRRADAADQVRARQGLASRPAPDRRDQQDRPARCPRRRGPQRDLRSVRGARRERGAARFPDGLRLRPQWLGGDRSRRPAPRSGAAVRADPGACAAAQGRSRRAVFDAGDDLRLRPLSRPGADRAHPFRRGAAQHAGQVAGPRRPHHRAGAADQIAGLSRARPAADRGGPGRRHHRRRRAHSDDGRRHDLRAGGHRRRFPPIRSTRRPWR